MDNMNNCPYQVIVSFSLAPDNYIYKTQQTVYTFAEIMIEGIIEEQVI